VLVLILAAPLFSAETIDRIVATVNGRPVMESEMDEQLRFEQFLAGKPAQAIPAVEQRAGLERVIDQNLLQQEMDSVNYEQPTADEIHKRMQELRQQLAPTTNAWQRSLVLYGLTEADVAEHVAAQLRTLHFVDARFRPAIRVDPSAVEIYYREQFLPKLKQAGAAPVPLKQVEPRIQEILAQQQMDELLENWLKALRLQTEIRLPVPSSALGAVQPAKQPQAAEVR
jgi:hypothetical protein